MSLKDFYKQHKFWFEGHSQMCEEVTIFLRDIVNKEGIINVMEIGFNGGHSAETLLSSNNNINLVSFDLGEHKYVELGKQFIDEHYSGRHTLIIGNSVNTVPEYIGDKFDIIFIDGGHDYVTAKTDLYNCRRLSHNDTIIILDDTMRTPEWIKFHNKGPNRAWDFMKKKNIIQELGSIDFNPRHGVSWGNYK